MPACLASNDNIYKRGVSRQSRNIPHSGSVDPNDPKILKIGKWPKFSNGCVIDPKFLKAFKGGKRRKIFDIRHVQLKHFEMNELLQRRQIRGSCSI